MAYTIRYRSLARAFLPHRASILLGPASGIVVAGLAAASGGYFASTWSWTALALLWTAAAGFVLTRLEVDRLTVLAIGGIAAFGAWLALSAAWAPSVASLDEGERVLAYVAGVVAAFVVVRKDAMRLFAGGVFGGISIVATYSLATRLFPRRFGVFDSFAGYRLDAPIGYWNALGLLVVLGLIVGVGIVQGVRIGPRLLVAGALVILLPTLYFTFSRGSWIALAIGAVAAVGLDSRRLRLLTWIGALAPAPALAVWLASRSDALTTKHASISAASRDGGRLAIAVLILALANAAIAGGMAYLERRVVVPARIQLVFAVLLGAAVLAGTIGAVVRYGSPPTLAHKAWHAFNAPPPKVRGNLNRRLFNLSGNGRVDLWRAAWADFKSHPVVGSGAGTYQQYWLQHRPTDLYVRDAHNLYLETLAELGVVGLVLLAFMLGIPLVAGIRARGNPLVPAIFGAYVAYLGHAAVDWDWEMPAVTLTALFCGAALVIAARDETKAKRLSTRVWVGALAATLALGALAFVGLIGNLALSSSHDAAREGHWHKAASEARRAVDWAPWSSDALAALGDAEYGQGHELAARRAYLRAVAKNPRDYTLWLDLAAASRGHARAHAFAQAHRLNPFDA